MVQLSAETSAQCAMVMATEQDRSRPGGPYVTAGLRKTSDPSSDKALCKHKSHHLAFMQMFIFSNLEMADCDFDKHKPMSIPSVTSA